MSPHVWLLAHNLSNAAILGTGTLGIVVWIGVAVLLLALLILMRTRWGQSQPLSKCVVLSVFAHLLLFLYAHGTRLLDGRPTLGSDTPIHVAFIATVAQSNEGAAMSESSTQRRMNDTEEAQEATESEPASEPWERLPDGEPVLADATKAQRMATVAEFVARSAPLETPITDGEVVPRDSLPPAEIDRPVAEIRFPVTIQSPVQPAAIEEPPSEEPKSPPPPTQPNPTPEPVTPERIETDPNTELSTSRPNAAHLPRRSDGRWFADAATG